MDSQTSHLSPPRAASKWGGSIRQAAREIGVSISRDLKAIHPRRRLEQGVSLEVPVESVSARDWDRARAEIHEPSKEAEAIEVRGAFARDHNSASLRPVHCTAGP